MVKVDLGYDERTHGYLEPSPIPAMYLVKYRFPPEMHIQAFYETAPRVCGAIE